MGLTAGGAVPRSNADANLVLRIEEQFYSFKQFAGASTPGAQVVRGGLGTSHGATLPSIFGNNVVPAGATFVVVAGRPILNVVSAAGTNGRLDATADRAAIPISQEFQSAGALNGILLNRPLRQYTLKVPVRRTVAGTAVLEFGLCTNNVFFLTFGSTLPGVVWSSNPAVNAGRWLPRSRQVSAGAILDGPDSNVTPIDFHLLGIRYTEGVVPTIEWLLDDVPRHLITGDAAMPDIPGGAIFPAFCPGYGVSSPAGSTWQFGQGSLEIRNIGV